MEFKIQVAEMKSVWVYFSAWYVSVSIHTMFMFLLLLLQNNPLSTKPNERIVTKFKLKLMYYKIIVPNFSYYHINFLTKLRKMILYRIVLFRTEIEPGISQIQSRSHNGSTVKFNQKCF